MRRFDLNDEDGETDSGSFPTSRPTWKKEPFLWRQSFAKEESAHEYVDENGDEVPWIEKQAEVWRRYGQGLRPGRDEIDTVVLDFLESPCDDIGAERGPHFTCDDIEAERVLDFTHGANLKALRAEKWTRTEPLLENFWIDERSFRDGVHCSRPNTEPLTAHGAFHRLRKPVVETGAGPATSTIEAEAQIALTESSERADVSLLSCQCLHCGPSPGPHGATEGADTGEPEADAERQLIYVHDLDRWSACALIGTVPSLHRETLGDVLRRHAAAETFIGVTTPVSYLKLFRLEAHLPFKVWKQSPEVCVDQRTGRNGKPLRKATDVTFLNLEPNPTPEYLYDCHLSFVVVGPNERVWTAYLLEDKYFHGLEDRYNLSEYFEASQDLNGVPLDPLSNGNLSADFPIRTPREYFIAVFRPHTQQLERFWKQVSDRVSKSIDDYEKLTRDMIEFVEAYRMFMQREASIFQDLDETYRGFHHLKAIEKSVGELEKVQRKFKNMEKQCQECLDDLNHALMLQSIRASNHSKGLADVMVDRVVGIMVRNRLL
ncbi:hypothetical protein ABEF95_001472 [Exophiala dermatitidis]